MKRHLVTILVVLSMMMAFVGTVGAASEVNVKFLDAVWTGGGVKFTFEVDQDLEGNGWLTASVSWDGGSAGMTCNQEGNIVACMGPKNSADKDITVFFQGYSFQTYVKSRLFCYSVYDWNSLSGATYWVNYGDYCQDDPATYGDMINWENPGLGGTWPYMFLPVSPYELTCSFTPVYGDAYYYPSCPQLID